MEEFFKFIPEEEAKYWKTKNYEISSRISPYWNKCGCTNPRINKDFPYLMQLLDNTQNYNYKEWIQIANKNLNKFIMYDCKEILQKELKANEIEIDNQTLDEIIFVRIIWETWMGYCCEHDVYLFIKNELMNIQQIQSPPGWMDAKCGVDLIITTKDNKKIALQVKPSSFLLLNDNKKEVAKQKIQQFCNDYNASYMFVYTDNGMISAVSKQQLRRAIDNGKIEKIDCYENQRVFKTNI